MALGALPAQARAWVPSRTMPSLKQARTTYQSIADEVAVAALGVAGDQLVAGRAGRRRWAERAGDHRGHGVVGRRRGSGQVASSQPRSSSGSPIVHISQSTMAASSGPSGANITLARW